MGFPLFVTLTIRHGPKEQDHFEHSGHLENDFESGKVVPKSLVFQIGW